ncbi:MAG: sulfur carrier protein ThiS [Pirellulales bacterium]
MTIQLNGEPRDVPDETTIAAALVELAMNPKFCAVEVNRELVPRGEHAAHRLRPGDRVEIVTLVGGG